MITVVTGEPRSGTSLMMSVLKELGLDILGSKFPSKNNKSKRKIERAKYLNPEGFWEVSGLVSRGASKDALDILNGKTVKLICGAMLGTPREVINEIDKIIFCARNPREVMQSQTKLVSSVMVASEDDWKFSPEISKIDYSRYKNSVGRYIIASQNVNIWKKTLVVDYHDMLFDTVNQIKRICDFLNIPYEVETLYYKDGEVIESFTDNIKNASSLIRSDLYRSRMAKEHDKLAMSLYEGIRKKKFNKLEKPIKKFIEKIKLKRVRWLDDTEYKTWVVAGWDLHKSLKINNKGIIDKLLTTARINSLPSDCVYYDTTGRREYTIRRVKELPDLTRTKITCEECHYFTEIECPEVILKRPKGEVTRESCYNCWQNKMIKKSDSKTDFSGM